VTPSWTILLYHNISWEETPGSRGIEGATHPPDVLREHAATLSRVGRLVSVEEGIRRLRSGDLPSPLFSFWFDDGLADVRRYALPILSEHGVTGAVSVCSRFVDRKELHWQFKLSFLAHVDGLRILRSRLRKHGFMTGMSLKRFTMDHCSEAVLEAVSRVYEGCTTPEERAAALELFADRDGLRELQKAGWLVTNHTAAHYPVGEDSFIHKLEDQFAECADELGDLLAGSPEYWVLPCDRPMHRSPTLLECFGQAGGDRYLILVGNQRTEPDDLDRRLLFRVCAPACGGDELLRVIQGK